MPQAIRIAALIIASGITNAAAQQTHWSSFNGFFPGMSKASAKAAGYKACRHGKESERKDSVYCEIPAAKRTLGPLVATKANVEFLGHRLDSVGEIHLNFEAKVETVRAQLTAKYGKPIDTGTYYQWHRHGPETIELYQRQRSSTAYVTFRYDKSLGDARKKAQQSEAKQKAVLKSF